MSLRVIVYGVGDNFVHWHDWIKEHYEIVCIADGSPEKHGMNIEGMIVHSAKEMKNFSYDKILITPTKYLGITRRLIDDGFDADRFILLRDKVNIAIDSKNKLRICFFLIGGLGDKIIAVNYLYYFIKRFCGSNCSITVATGRGSVDGIIKKGDGFEAIYENVSTDFIKLQQYDLVVEIRRFPKILSRRLGKIAKMIPDLVDYIFLLEKFRIFHLHFFNTEFEADGHSNYFEEIFSKKRLQQPDVYNFLNISEKYEYPIDANKDILKKFDLEGAKYITVHRGCEKKNFSTDSVKLWPEKNYEKLCCLVKKWFPDYLVILIGEDYEKSEIIKTVDANLVGNTNFEDIKALLKFSSMHIDTEGGLVHLRHALNGGVSTVIFGPASSEFYGYKENINIQTTECPVSCEWAVALWEKHCINEKSPNICMKSIAPEMVIERIKAQWKGDSM